MVPSGELHISAVDYKHTHHPYFCIVKHADSGASQESLPFHLTLRGGPSQSSQYCGVYLICLVRLWQKFVFILDKK